MTTEPANPRHVISPEQTSFTGPQMAELRRLGYIEAKRSDLDAFFQYAKTYGLDPFSGEIVQIGRHGQMKLQVTITGYRKVVSKLAYDAGLTGQIIDMFYEDAHGQRHYTWPPGEPLPEGEDAPVPSAVVISLSVRDDVYVGAAAWTEYVLINEDGTIGDRWEDDPARWLRNIAEALAWRQVFPAELNDLMLNEEMRQADRWTSNRKGKDQDYGNMRTLAMPEPTNPKNDKKDVI